MLIVIITALYSSPWRPLWLDEMMQFTLSGMHLDEALRTIWETTGPAVNFGQTGFYYFLDYLLPSWFGANLVVIRLPSVVAALVMLSTAVIFVRLNGFGRIWQGVIVLAFAGQGTVMYYSGEARHYLPMASFAVATLAYYRFPLDRRRAWLSNLIGLYAIVVGAVFHPYYPAFLLAIFTFSSWVAMRSGGLARSRVDLWQFANPRLVVSGLVLYCGIGALTWLKGTPDMDNGAVGLGGLVQNALAKHLEFLYIPQDFPLAPSSGVVDWWNYRVVGPVIVICITALPFAAWKWRRMLVPPVVLFWLSIGTTAVLSALSYSRGYLALDRQWLGGIALGTIAVVWLMAELQRAAGHAGSVVWRVPVVAFMLVVVVGGGFALVGQVRQILFYRGLWSVLEADVRSGSEVAAGARSSDDWVYLANLNVVRGGPPWRELAGYYNVRDP
jgi:hypothetical protein